MAHLFSSPSEVLALKAICSKDRAISGFMLSNVDESYFHNEESQEAYDAIIKYMGRKGSVPAFGLLVEELGLSEGAREFLKLSEGRIKTQQQAEQLVENLGGYRRTRLLYKLAKGILNRLQKDAVDVQALAEAVADKVAIINSVRTTENSIWHVGRESNVSDLVEEIIYGEDTSHVIPTGFKHYDSVNGGFKRGSLVLIGGSTGSGKSLISNQLAMNQASIGYKVHFVPLEMTEQEMLSRSIANVSGIDGSKIQLRRMAEAEKEQAHKRWRRFERRMLKAGGRLTIFKPQTDMRIEEIMGALHAMPGDVKYIDYVSLLKGTDGDDQWRQLGNVARYGKIYATNTNSTVVLLCQVTDDGIVRYSRTMAEHANTSWRFTATKETREKGFLRVEMTKGRNERLITFVLKVDYSTQKATDMTPEELDELAAASAGGAKSARKGTKKSRRNNENSKEEGDEYLPDLTGDSV